MDPRGSGFLGQEIGFGRQAFALIGIYEAEVIVPGEGGFRTHE